MRLIRVGHVLWAIYKRSCGKTPQVNESKALLAALESVWECKRELRVEMKAQHRAKVRIHNGRFAHNHYFLGRLNAAQSAVTIQ